VANLFRVLQRHFEPFLDMLRWRLTSREEFHRLMALEPTSLTDLERAARFIYLQRVSWGGKVTGRTFQVSLTNPGKFNLPRLVTVLEEVHERLAGVVIENLPYQELIPRYDRPETLFYLDPPYWACEGVYGAELFSRDEFTRLADVLRGVKGRFILSLNDHPGVRACFKGFDMEVVETTYAMGYRTGKETQRVRELLISNTGK
jgi:DNA adenine methylase